MRHIAMVGRAVLAVLLLVALGWLYVSGVSIISDMIARRLTKEETSGVAALPPDQTWELAGESAHIAYYARPGDEIPQWALAMHESMLAELSRDLSINPVQKIRYFKYASQEDMYEATRRLTTGVTLQGPNGPEVHTVLKYDTHEVVHAVTHQFWDPPAFLDEGVATSYGMDWDEAEASAHDHAHQLLIQGRLLPLENVLTNWGFRLYKAYPAYSTAGSFTKYLLQSFETERYRKLLRLAKFSPRQEIEEVFYETYGLSIYEVEVTWREALAAGLLSSGATATPSEPDREELLYYGALLFAGIFILSFVIIVAGERTVGALARVMRRLRRSGRPTKGNRNGTPPDLQQHP